MTQIWLIFSFASIALFRTLQNLNLWQNIFQIFVTLSVIEYWPLRDCISRYSRLLRVCFVFIYGQYFVRTVKTFICDLTVACLEMVNVMIRSTCIICWRFTLLILTTKEYALWSSVRCVLPRICSSIKLVKTWCNFELSLLGHFTLSESISTSSSLSRRSYWSFLFMN